MLRVPLGTSVISQTSSEHAQVGNSYPAGVKPEITSPPCLPVAASSIAANFSVPPTELQLQEQELLHGEVSAVFRGPVVAAASSDIGIPPRMPMLYINSDAQHSST